MQVRGHGWAPRISRRHLSPSAYLCVCRIAKRPYSSQQSGPPHFAVLGGGISGLASAYYLTQAFPQARITIYEAQDRLGGWIRSTRVPVKGGDVLFEAASRTLRPQGNGTLSVRLMQELDLAKDAIFVHKASPAASSRFLYYPDRLVRMPHPSLGFWRNLQTILFEPVMQTVWHAVPSEIFKNRLADRPDDESIGEYMSRRFTPTMVDRLLSAVIHGIYAGDVWKLSAKSLLSAAWRNEETSGSVIMGFMRNLSEGAEVTTRQANFLTAMKSFHFEPLLRKTILSTSVFTFKDGLSMLVDRLARHLLQTGKVEFKTSTAITRIAAGEDQASVAITAEGSEQPVEYTQVISTLAPWDLNHAHGSSSSATTLIPEIPTVSVMVVNLFYRTPNLHPPGFGYLIPQATPFENNPERALGVIFDTACSPTPEDVDMKNWQIQDADVLKVARERGEMVNVNDFTWYNMPNKPNTVDNLQEGGTKFTVMLGGHWWNDWPVYPSEEDGVAMAKSVLKRHLGITEEPEAWLAQLNKDCIPQYTVGHERRLKTAHDTLWQKFHGRLRVAGNWMWGVGVNDALRSAWEVVQSIKHGKDGTGLEHLVDPKYVRVKTMAGKKSDEET